MPDVILVSIIIGEIQRIPLRFSEKVKQTVKRRAAFRCCRCHEIGVEVHHILPREYGGTGDGDNAAPLCPNCHTRFGDNPKKRLEIRQMRDWWYEVCKEKYSGSNETMERLDQLISEVRQLSEGERGRESVIREIRHTLNDLVKVNQPQEGDSAETVADKVDAIVTATRLGPGVWANVRCNNCNSVTGLLLGSDSCPSCGEPLR